MTQFLTLLKIEFKNKKEVLPEKNKKTNLFFKGLFFLLKNAITVWFLVMLSSYVTKYAITNQLENDFLNILFTFVFVVQFFVGLNQIVKSQQASHQNKETLLMPVNNQTLYFSKIVYIYIKCIFTYIILLLPVLITWGVLTSQSLYFYFMILPTILLLPIVPLLVASLFAFPVLKLTNFLKSRFFISFIVFASILAVGFYYYIEILKIVLEVVQNQNTTTFLTAADVISIQAVTSKLFVGVLFKNILTGFIVLKSLLVILTISAFCFITVFNLAKKYYRNLMWKAADSSVNHGYKKTKFKNIPSGLALLIKEFKTVFRNYNHSFSFFTIGLTTPLIVFLSSKAISEFSFAKTNISVYPPISLFLLLIFITLTTSFSATTISREGKSFLITKTLPIKAKTQIKAKMLFYMIMEVFAVFVSLLSLNLAGLISLLDFALIFIIVILIVYGGVCSYIGIDIKNPKHQEVKTANDTLSNINIAKSMTGGLLFAISLGIVAITLSFIVKNNFWYVPIFVIGLAYAVYKHFKLFKNLESKYNDIEV